MSISVSIYLDYLYLYLNIEYPFIYIYIYTHTQHALNQYSLANVSDSLSFEVRNTRSVTCMQGGDDNTRHTTYIQTRVPERRSDTA